MSEETTGTAAAQAEKPKLPAIRTQDVYRLANGEFADFEESGAVDKTDFYKIFHREMSKDGELLLEIEYDADGNELQKTQHTLNDQGKIVKHELYNEGQLAEEIIYEYDEKGRIIREVRKFEDGFPLTTNFIYNDKDQVIEKRIDDDEGELQKRETFEYHPEWKDKVIRHLVYDEENKLTVEEDNEWEERGGEVKARKFIVRDHSFKTYRRTEFFDPKTREDNIAFATFNEKEKVLEYVKVLHDEKGRDLEEHSISVNDSDNFIVYYTYDELDRVVAQEQHQQDKIISKINRRFNEQGHAELIAIRSFSRGMYVDVFEYEYYS
jgi:YD repeat-containing protein